MRATRARERDTRAFDREARPFIAVATDAAVWDLRGSVTRLVADSAAAVIMAPLAITQGSGLGRSAERLRHVRERASREFKELVSPLSESDAGSLNLMELLAM